MTELDWGTLSDQALGNFTLADLPPTLSLPALPLAVTRFIEKSKQPQVDVKELVRIIETDTGLTVELLRHVNSSYVGLKTKARTILHALTLLGLRQAKMIVITIGMKAAAQARNSKLINQACFWNASLQKALFAREVALLLRADPDIAFAGALLQDYLIPVLTSDLYDTYSIFVQTRDQQPMNICDFEQSHFGWDHALAGACLARRWQLPDELVCCVLFHHHGMHMLAHPQLSRTPVAAVALSALLPDQMRQCYQGLEQLLLLQSKWPAFNLQKLAETVDEKHSEIGFGVQNDFPLLRRCRPVLEAQAAPALA